MSERFPGGIISKTAPVPTGPYENGTAPGVWTLEQQAEFVKQGIWPIAGNVPNYIEDVFQTWLYTGTSSSQSINNGIDLAGKGGLVWTKARNLGDYNILIDTVRGANNALASDLTNAQFTYGNTVTAFGSTGFTAGTTYNGYNVATWTFREQPKFFDVVTYTGNGQNNRQIAHNLGSVPGCIMVKRTNAAADWYVYHRGLNGGVNPQNHFILLNSTAAQGTYEVWENTAPTSTVFTVDEFSSVNGSGDTFVAYLFAHNAGGFGLSATDNVISCGSYTGAGASTTVTLGYEPQWILIKRTDVAGPWHLQDVMRGATIPADDNGVLYPNTSQAEQPKGSHVFPTATGFAFTANESDINASGGTYIYIAIRRGPMKIPTTGTSVYNAVTVTGNSTANRAITGYGFPLDLLLSAGRTGTYIDRTWNNRLTNIYYVRSTTTAAQDVQFGGLASPVFATQDGYVTGTNGGVQYFWNNSGDTYVQYGMRRAPGFMDVVCYTGNGSTQTVAHNLGVVPELIIAKNRGQAGNNWPVLFNFASTTMNYGFLNLTNSCPNDTYANAGVFSAAPTSTSMFLTNSSSMNASGFGIVSYLFASAPGVSKVGSYTGTGATQVINCGFTTGARFVLIKATSTTGEWYVWDSARGIVAGNDPYLELNTTDAEVTGTDWVDTASTGFELSNAGGNLANSNGVSYIFLAIA